MMDRRAMVVLLSLLLAIPPLILGQVPAYGAPWSGSTPDDGMGHSITAEGTTTETIAPDPGLVSGVTTFTMESTTTWRDNATGKVIKVIKRKRVVKKRYTMAIGGVRFPAETLQIKVDQVTETPNPAGGVTRTTVSESSAEAQVMPGMGRMPRRWERTRRTDELDANGAVQSGAEERIRWFGAQRITGEKRFDPTKNAWVEKQQTDTLQVSKAPTIYLPEGASAGGVVMGTIVTEVNATAAGVVIAKAPDGRQQSALVDPNGHFLLSPEIVVSGALALTFQDQAERTVAERTLQVAANPRTDAGQAPKINQVPIILPAGGVGSLTGTNLCSAQTLDGPQVFLSTKLGVQPLAVLSATENQIRYRVQEATLEISAAQRPGEAGGVPIGAGSVVVENGAGQMSSPFMTNPVRISVTVPPRVSMGQQFNASIAVLGLTPENLQKPLVATVEVSGNAVFPGGQRQMRVPISNGTGQAPLIAVAPGEFFLRAVQFDIRQ